MSKTRIFVTRAIPQVGLQQLMQQFAVEVWPERAAPSKAQLIARIGNVDAIVSLIADKIDAEVFAAAPNLKIISQFAVGFDNIDINTATQKGIYVTNTPEVLTETSADMAWALLMAVSRRIVEADKYVRAGQWQVAGSPELLLGSDIHGATLGIVGAGRIGQAVARRARGFAMKILYYNSSPKPEMEKECGAQRVDLETLLKRSDFVSLHVPLNDKTAKLIDADKLQLMKKTAYLINNSRGAVINENALYQALLAGRIAGAGLDVFAQEPTPAGNPLLGLANVVVAPHISSASNATRGKMAKMVADNLLTFFAGKQPPDLVNPGVTAVRPLPAD